MLEKLLQRIGLPSNEAKIYLAAFTLGTQDVSMLAKYVRLPRYDVLAGLHHLQKRGFVTHFTKGKTFYTALPPDTILKILENSKGRFQPHLKIFRKMLPQFSVYRNPASARPKMSFYEGKAGMLAAYEDTLSAKTDILAFTSIADTESTFPRYVPRYYQRRRAAGILIKAIFPDTKMARLRHKHDEQELRVSRLIPHDQYDFSIEINIYDHKVAYFSLKESFAVIVESAAIAESMRNVFHLSWEMAGFLEKSLKKK